jgi:hypothetical protein
MMDAQAYTFMLDFIPLTDCVHEQNPTFADLLQRKALDAIVAGTPSSADLDALHSLLRLSCDLGYIDADVLRYLETQLERVAAVAARTGS